MDFHCPECDFGKSIAVNRADDQVKSLLAKVGMQDSKKPLRRNRTGKKAARERIRGRYSDVLHRVTALPQEIILLILSKLDTEELLALCACNEIRGIVADYDLVRLREVECFILKKSFMEVRLGVGVQVGGGRGTGRLASEFDLLSQEAFTSFKIRKSVQGLPFQHWMPLPISRRHWNPVRKDADVAIANLAQAARLGEMGTKADVLYHFMNDLVVRFSRTTEQYFGCRNDHPESSLAHASEKAIESYFALFHLLLCVVIEEEAIVKDAYCMLEEFQNGRTSKSHCPNLGRLLVAILVCEQDMTEDMTFLIIKEAITRNVVWMLDPKGAGMVELSYLEPSAESEYRLRATFEASKTSYRLLMFFNLFRKTARPPGKSILQVCDEAFKAHGVPPKGTTQRLTSEIRRIHAIDRFPPFLKYMGITVMPNKQEFTEFLRDSVQDSMSLGYSVWPLDVSQAYAIRQTREPGVEIIPGIVPGQEIPRLSRMNFFPGRKR